MDNMDIEKKITEKLKLFKQLHIRVTKEIKQKLYACNNEIQLDNVARTIIINNL